MKSSRWPIGLLGMLLIVAAVETHVGRHAFDYVDTFALSWRLSDDAAYREAVGADRLILGDSLMRHGLLPDVIDARLGGRSFNLAITASTAPAAYLVLRHALDAGARPKAIVVDFMPDLLSGRLQNVWRHWSLIVSTREILTLAFRSREFSFLVATGLDRLIPSNRSRWEIRSKIVAALNGSAHPLRDRNTAHRAGWLKARGGEFTPENRAFRGDIDGYEQFFKEAGYFRVNRINRLYIHELFRLAEARDIKVYWLLPPVTPALQDWRAGRRTDEAYRRFVGEVAGAHPGVVVVDGRDLGLMATDFIDPVHLNGKGGTALSRALAEVMASRPSGWVRLGPSGSEPGLIAEGTGRSEARR